MPEETDISPIDTPPTTTVEGDLGGSSLAAISRDIVGVHARFYGRGPTKAKTIWRDELVLCVLEDIFTKAEQLLVDGGHFEEVRLHRIAFQDEVEPLLRASVEAVTDRPVRSFLSQVSIDGAASEVFVLGDAAPAPTTQGAWPRATGVPWPIATADPEPIEDGQDHAGLAELLSDQFAVLDDTRPTRPRAVEDGDVVIFAFTWPLSLADEVLTSSGREQQLTRFRTEFLRIIRPSLAGLVELELRREVTSSLPTLGDDPRQAMVSFALGARKGEDREAAEALRAWTTQLRRKARDERSRLQTRREELRRLRDEIALERGSTR